MKILMIGDVVGKPGRQSLLHHIPLLQEKYTIDCIIANGENCTHGFGITEKTANDLLRAGVNVITGGNHSWDRKEIIPLFDTIPTLIRPANFPDAPGQGWCIFTTSSGTRVGIINLLGIYGMPNIDNPFRMIETLVDAIRPLCDILVIDFHAESTSEKYALFHLLKGKVDAIVGTHTHVGTDDLFIHDTTAFVSDIGLTGCRDGVIGVEPEAVLMRLMQGISHSFSIKDSCQTIFQAILLEFDNHTISSIQKIKAYGKNDFFIAYKGHHE